VHGELVTAVASCEQSQFTNRTDNLISQIKGQCRLRMYENKLMRRDFSVGGRKQEEAREHHT
jgi:hypothetical protein